MDQSNTPDDIADYWAEIQESLTDAPNAWALLFVEI